MNETRRRTSLIPFPVQQSSVLCRSLDTPRSNRYGESFFRRLDESENGGFSRRWVCRRGEQPVLLSSLLDCVHVYVGSEGEEGRGEP